MIVCYNVTISTNDNAGARCPLFGYIATAITSSKKLIKNIIVKKVAEGVRWTLRTGQVITHLLGIGFCFNVHNGGQCRCCRLSKINGAGRNIIFIQARQFIIRWNNAGLLTGIHGFVFYIFTISPNYSKRSNSTDGNGS